MSATDHSDVPQAAVCRPHARHATVRPVQGQAAPKLAPALYQVRNPEQSLFYRTIAGHFETWLALASSGQFDGQGDLHTPAPYVEANTSSVASLLTASPVLVVTPAAMIFWWRFPAKGAACAPRAIRVVWWKRQRIFQITYFPSCPCGNGCCRYRSAYAIFCNMIPRRSIPHCEFFCG
jgi:hypothetical protein